ncbi:MAG: hypothetical protein ACHQCF_01265 [Solirubrobacterales bacterium]
MEDSEAVLDRALLYPYETPASSFVLAGERTLDPGSAELGPAAREPLLAYGANVAPAVLARKLGKSAVPVLARRAMLRGFDVVYSAHISLYGAVPATLIASAPTEVEVFVLLLTTGQRSALEATEPNYELTDLGPGACRLEDGGAIPRPPAYLSRHGPLEVGGSPVALAAVRASGRLLPEMSEADVLEHVRVILAPDEKLARFVLDCAADPGLARRRTEQLRPS